MIFKTEPTYQVKIYISGPIAIAEQVCRNECLAKGLCVTIEPTKFIYTGGEETGIVVGLLNYPRFPLDPASIYDRAKCLAGRLIDAMFQHSALVVAPDKTEWMSRREQ